MATLDSDPLTSPYVACCTPERIGHGDSFYLFGDWQSGPTMARYTDTE